MRSFSRRVSLFDARRTLSRSSCEAWMTDRAAPPYIARAYDTLSRVEEAAGNLEAALGALRSRPVIPIASQ